jgi:hypothetical protein
MRTGNKKGPPATQLKGIAEVNAVTGFWGGPRSSRWCISIATTSHSKALIVCNSFLEVTRSCSDRKGKGYRKLYEALGNGGPGSVQAWYGIGEAQ